MIHHLANGAFEPDRGQWNGGRGGCGDGLDSFGTLGARFRGGFFVGFTGDGFVGDAVGIDADEFTRSWRVEGLHDVVGEIDLKHWLFFLLLIAAVVPVVVIGKCIILLCFAIPSGPR